MNFIKIVNLRVSRRLTKVSHPVSKYNESLLANFVRPVTIFDKACLDKLKFNLRRTFTCFNADLAMFSICTVQFPSDTNVTPRCL